MVGALSAATAIGHSQAGQLLPSPKPGPLVLHIVQLQLHIVRPFLKGVSPFAVVCHDYSIQSIRKCQDWCQTLLQLGKKKIRKMGREKCPGQHQHSLRDFCYGL